MLLVYLPCPNQAEAKTIARQLLEEKLIVCANIYPQVESIYKWQGSIEESKETVVILKTSPEKYKTLAARIQELHSYDCPCIIGINADKLNTDAQNWLHQELLN